jgi:hypothetical protein
LGRGAVHVEFWWGNLKERDHFEDLGLNGRIILKWTFQKYFGVWTGFMWLRGETDGGIG